MPKPTSEPLRRAAIVLELVAMEPSGLAISQIVERLSLPAPTVFRIVRKLVSIGLLEGAGRYTLYRVGPRMHRIAELLYGSESFSSLAAQILQEVADTLHLAVYLSSLFEDESPLILTKVPHNARSAFVHPGPQFPVHASAGGKVLLAYQSKNEQEEFFKDKTLQRYTPRTVTDPDSLRTELAIIREQGFATSIGEADETLWGLAYPVRDARSAVSYAVGVIGLRDGKIDADTQDSTLHVTLARTARKIEQLFPRVSRF